MESMYTNQVWTLVDPPKGVIRCKWVFKNKIDMDGKVSTFKAWLVIEGFKKVHGINYDKTKGVHGYGSIRDPTRDN